MSEDPTFDGNNWYSYCAGDPINATDPTGLCLVKVSKSHQSYTNYTHWNNKCNKKNCLTKEQKLFIATIAGEAIGQSSKAWQAVAHVIKNRVDDKKHEFKKFRTVSAVIKQPWAFTCYTRKESEYVKCNNYLKNRTRKNKRYEQLINTVMPIYKRKLTRSIDYTLGSLLYYSPRSMEKGKVPSWSKSSALSEVKVSGISRNNFRFYRYKK